MKSPKTFAAWLTAAIPILLVLIALVSSGVVGAENILDVAARFPIVEDDTIQMHQRYLYREIGADYDSVSAICVFGEMFVIEPDGDSTLVMFNNMTGSTYSNGIDNVNERCRTKPMILNQESEITLFRSMQYAHVDDNQVDLGLQDSVTWVFRIHDQQTNAMLAMIDSVCLLRKDTGMLTFPPFTGTLGSTSWDLLNVSCINLPQECFNDSVYLSVEIGTTGDAASYFYSDFLRFNSKYSDYKNMGKSASKQRPVRDGDYALNVYPNPNKGAMFVDVETASSDGMRIRVLGMDGKIIDDVFLRGSDARTTRQYYSLPSDAPAGVYLVVLAKNDGAVICTKRFAVVK